jgi:hypothetical protein
MEAGALFVINAYVKFQIYQSMVKHNCVIQLI